MESRELILYVEQKLVGIVFVDLGEIRI